jgi:uncharacterized repeat protein (TIGR02543 family)
MLAVMKFSTGSGVVTSNPAGIDCGDTCGWNFASGTVVTLTAQPSPGSEFMGWGNECSGSGTATTCTLTMSASRDVSARFDPILWTLTTTVNGKGYLRSIPAFIDCPATSCSGQLASGTTVTLTATAGSGYLFDAWTGCAGTGPVCTVTMDAAHTVTATFGKAQTLTVSRTGSGTGTVTSSDGGIDCGTDCSEVYPSNRVVTLTATPANGATFLGWGGACKGLSPTCTLTMSGNRNAEAKFKQ